MNADLFVPQTIQDELMLCQKRYQIAMSCVSDIIFDYIVESNLLVGCIGKPVWPGLPENTQSTPEDILAAGIIRDKSLENFKRLFERVRKGDSVSSGTIILTGRDGGEHIYEVTMTNLFGGHGEPIRAIGIIKNITDNSRLQLENAYKGAMLSESVLSCEANVTQDKITGYDKQWEREFGPFRPRSRSQALEHMASTIIAPEHSEMFLAKSSNEAVVASYENGRKIIEFEYLKRSAESDYEWFRKTIHIVRDELTLDINIRSFVRNISEQKQNSESSRDGKYLYASMAAKAEAVYEVNVTKNLFVQGHENWGELFDIEVSGDYTEMINAISEHAVHPEDRSVFNATFNRSAVLRARAQGKCEVGCEYRRPGAGGRFIWVYCSLNLYEDSVSGDIRGSSFVNNIDAQKREQLELEYKAQRDSLTGFYNKETLKQKISSFLVTSEAKVRSHAFIMLDLDYFKGINDNFGHAFGDACLSQAVSKISSLFRDEDILGRIGGDEFAVFMKNVQSESAVRSKAEELCKTLRDAYTKNKVLHHISASVGIAIYAVHGRTYDELYKNADTALYFAKEHGRSRFDFYDSSMKFGATSVKNIDRSWLPRVGVFERSISEYVFRILYEASDKEAAINLVLELIGKHFENSRACVFENSPDGSFAECTFEWCADGVPSQDESLARLRYSPDGDYKNGFNGNGYLYVASVDTTENIFKSQMQRSGIKSLLQFSIEKNGDFFGFLEFQQCDRTRTLTQTELGECRNMANVIGIFITEMRATQQALAMKLESESARSMVLAVVNAMGSYAYVCNPVTHEMLFINDTTAEIVPLAKTGDICYRAVWRRDTPCEDCPMQSLTDEKNKVRTEMFNTNLRRWFKVTASRLRWLDGEPACLVDSVDITDYKNGLL